MNGAQEVSVAKIAELLDLKNLIDDIDLKARKIECSDVNRPALQLSGYFEHFEQSRIQIIGNVEYTYIEKMNDDEKRNYSDINYLKKNFYTVAAITDLLEGDIKPEEFLAMDFSLNTEEKGPKVLIFHTHSHEGYADSDMSNGLEDGIIGTGERLKDILENDYGIETMHCTQSFDYVDSKMTTTGAYERMEPVIEQILKENPSIEIAIDLHRDGVKDETVRLVTQINDKPTAQLMFFNGICRIYDGDRLIKTAGLDSPYINENLAFSFCMKYAADKLYSGLARKNYINAYRYSLNMLPKSLLVEVGAQTNTKEEAMNAMEPLAEILYSVINKNNT